MPHDRKGVALKKGDHVIIPVRPIELLQVQRNPDCPDEFAPQVSLEGDGFRQLEAEVVELYPGEEACNAQFRIRGCTGVHTFNTRLVQKV